MKYSTIVVIVFLLFSSLFTFSLCKNDNNDDQDDYDVKVNTKIKDDGDSEIIVNVIIKNNHHHNEHEHTNELDDIQDDKANRCKGFGNSVILNGSDSEDSSVDKNDEKEDNSKSHNGGHHHYGSGRDICGCRFGRYGKECRKRELEYQNSFIQWSNSFNRTYTADQFLIKYETFKDSSRYIEQYQRENENSTMQLGLTQFSDMTHDEFLHVYTSKLYEMMPNETQPPVELCTVNITQTVVLSWNNGNQDYIQVETTITNMGPTTIRSYSFNLENIESIWNVDTISSGNSSNSSGSRYQLPNWISGIEAGSSHTFGYNQRSNQITPLTDKTSTCDQLPTPTPTTPITSCMINVTQSITRSWRESDTDFIQVEAIISNIGETDIQSYSFELNDITSIWNVESVSSNSNSSGNNRYQLPNWISSIVVASSHTFGYIQRSYSINPLLSVNKVCQEITNKPTTSGLLKTASTARPSSVDWRIHGAVSSVKNQGGCGSCYTFSAIGALEGHYFRKFKVMLDLSEQQLVDCTASYGNGGCSGGWMHNCYKYIQDNRGINEEHIYPYESRVGQCRYRTNNARSPVTKHVMIKQHDENDLAEAVANIGPVAVAYDASTREFMYYQSGIYDSASCSKYRTTHAVVVVGYGSENGVDFWTIKNSWGSTWGEMGYFRMRRNIGDRCGICSYSSYPIVA